MNTNHSMHVPLFLLIGLVAAAAASHISHEALQSHGTTGRTLLQAKKKCTVNFENMNYTIITSQCKGPQYPADKCCGALKEFSCPYASSINDLSSDCATTMFSYINLYGKFPPGLFANKCQEGQQGLDCGEESKYKAQNSGCHVAASKSAMLMLAPAVLVFIINVVLP